MAVDLGITNTSRYYTTPDDASFTLPDSDWAIISIARCDVGDSAAQYLWSTGSAPPLANTAHVLQSGVNLQMLTAYNTLASQEVSGAIPIGDWHMYVATRISGMLYSKICYLNPDNRSSVSSTSGVSVSGSTSNGGILIHGGRGDLSPNRMLRGALSWDALLIGKGLSDSEILDLQDGTTVLLDAPYAASVQNVWHFDSAASSTIVDIVNGKVATRVGTGYGADVADPILPFTTATGKGINLVLSDRASGAPRASVTGIVYRWYDSTTAAGAPVVFGTAGTTDASGVFNLDLAASSLDAGQVGYLVIFKQNGSAALDWHFSGRITVAAT